jgi:hypothetical protein
MRVHRFLKLSAAAMACLLVASVALAGEQEFAGNYELLSATRKILETGQTEDTFGKKPKGAWRCTDRTAISLFSSPMTDDPSLSRSKR